VHYSCRIHVHFTNLFFYYAIVKCQLSYIEKESATIYMQNHVTKITNSIASPRRSFRIQQICYERKKKKSIVAHFHTHRDTQEKLTNYDDEEKDKSRKQEKKKSTRK
jgi:hypothetical protein